ncbi:hypothetical protein EAF00_002966 [Botryotinia globosa]|nr:hypothetical protein EAF00_002966 [Botryotinia globosa]
MADTNISNWTAFWLYVSQTLYDRVSKNATRDDFENFLQKIPGIPPSFWDFSVFPMLSFLGVYIAICIVLKIIAAIGTIVSKFIQPISIPESLQAIGTIVSKFIQPFSIPKSLQAIGTIVSKFIQPFSIPESLQAIGTIVSKFIQPISIPESLQVIDTIVSKFIQPFLIFKSLQAIETIISKFIQSISIHESLQAIGIIVSKFIQPISIHESLQAICTLASDVSKYACILMPVMLLTLCFVLVVLWKLIPAKHVSMIVNFYFTPYKTPEQSMAPPLINGH